ncbi:MAG: hypothetical protein EAZ89_06115 [Bacteroidetes bacterium]|nr:MAG: hypothetical protein EAZ89_06115 [Bacteroidota bacterium]
MTASGQKTITELYGFKLGQARESIVPQLGKPSKADVFDDGFEYEYYLLPKKKIDVYFEFAVGNTEKIWSIQVSGTDTTVDIGLQGVRLGMDRARVEAVFGPPSKKKDIGQYGQQWMYNNTNYSFEINPKGKLSSIKITDDFSPPAPSAQDVVSSLPKEIQQVVHYIRKQEYLELFGDSSHAYQFRPRGWEITDIDNDGITEVFFLIYPHFAQTAPIQIYQIQKNGTVTRVKESLAPGNPVARTDEYLDSHNGGYAADLTIEKPDKETNRKLAEMSMKFGTTVLEFPNFFHTDDRMDNGGGYIDLSYSNYSYANPSCENIQLAKPLGMASGELKAKSGKYLAVAVDTEIWIYKIKRIDEMGFLDKELTIIPLPKGFFGFKSGEKTLSYLNNKGAILPVEVK